MGAHFLMLEHEEMAVTDVHEYDCGAHKEVEKTKYKTPMKDLDKSDAFWKQVLENVLLKRSGVAPSEGERTESKLVFIIQKCQV